MGASRRCAALSFRFKKKFKDSIDKAYESSVLLRIMEKWGKKTLMSTADRVASFSLLVIFAIVSIATLIIYFFDPKRNIEN